MGVFSYIVLQTFLRRYDAKHHTRLREQFSSFTVSCPDDRSIKMATRCVDVSPGADLYLILEEGKDLRENSIDPKRGAQHLGHGKHVAETRYQGKRCSGSACRTGR